MFPWHLVRHTPEERAEIAKRLQRMQDRLDMPMEVVETTEGVIVRRDGNTGVGQTREEAIWDLYGKENHDAVYGTATN